MDELGPGSGASRHLSLPAAALMAPSIKVSLFDTSAPLTCAASPEFGIWLAPSCGICCGRVMKPPSDCTVCCFGGTLEATGGGCPDAVPFVCWDGMWVPGWDRWDCGLLCNIVKKSIEVEIINSCTFYIV